MARRMAKIEGMDRYGLRGWRARRDWDLWSVAAFVVILLAGIWGLGR